MAIPKNGCIIIALLLTTIVLETGRFSVHVSPVHYEEEHFVSREKRDAPSAPIEYDVDVELNITDIETVGYLKRLLDGGTFAVALGPTVNVTHINITTVCSSNGTSFQCQCEEQYGWSYTICITHGACDSILGGSCRCINSFPTNGEYCQPQTELPILYEYQIFVEVRTPDADTLRSILNSTPFPIEVSTQLNISEANITTVCSGDDSGIQCQCEDDYLWPCEKCATYGKCDGNTTSTCGCVKAFPNDGQYCQSVHHHNFFPCTDSTTSPPPTAPPVLYEYLISIELNTTDAAVIELLRNTSYPINITDDIQVTDLNISTVCSPSSGGYQCRCEDQYRWPCDHCVQYGTCDNITEDTCGCINTVPPDGQYCQPADPLNLTVCSKTTTPPPTNSTPTVTPTANVTTPPVVYEYMISIELNTTDDTDIKLLREISYPINITTNVQVSDLNITTVCSPSSGGYQCRCEDQYRWPCDHCVQYGTCDNITEDTCGCINTVPPDGQYCQPADELNFFPCTDSTTSPPPTAPPVLYEYLISIELNTTDAAVIELLRNTSYPINITDDIQVTDLNISTVCSPSSGGYQCRCEDQYRWTCDQCVQYGTCDNITEDTCGCINTVPPDGQYCQPADELNFFPCTDSTTSPPPTAPPVLYEYLISIELNTTDAAVIELLRNTSYPINITDDIQVTDLNISTVCSPSSGGYQCRCEDQYRWPCDHCVQYGTCDNITEDTCGCINTVPPDGQYCQPADPLNFFPCTDSTTSPPPTAPPVLYEYLISIELNTTDAAVIELLRNTSYPINITDDIQVTDLNISTVCSPSSGGYQCRCEDQYRWPCDHCVQYGTCDNITEDTCGCINTVPPDGQYCQPADPLNFFPCTDSTTSPPPTAPPVLYEYLISIELNTTDAAVIELLRNTSYPINITDDIQVTDLNISTVCSPSSGGYQCRCEDQYRWPCDHCVQYGTCDNITEDTCGCINTVPPDGQYCQPADELNFLPCTVSTTSPPPTAPPVLYEYLISIELNTTDAAVIELLRNTSYPINITDDIQVTDLNISTVCSPSSGGYQCRCEDQYRWPCDHCVQYGTCDNITEDTCGCINTVPPDGQYCQPADPLNLTVCSKTTTPPPTNSTTAVPPTSTTTATNSTPTVTPTANVTNSTTAVPPTSTTTATTTTSIANTTTSPINSTTAVPPTSTTTATNSTPTVTPTANVTNSTTAVPPTSTTTATTTTSIANTTTSPISFDVIMSIELNRTYTDDLDDKSSVGYTDLVGEIKPVLEREYADITGYLRVSVIRFRKGSTIADFVVQTTQIIPDEVASANTNLTKAINDTIGSVTAMYNSPTPLSLPILTYTGQAMTLRCNPENVNVGNINASKWTFNGTEINTDSTRFTVLNSRVSSNLTIKNVILRDSGLYECFLTGGIISFRQKSTVTTNKINQAPNIQLQEDINVACEEGKEIPLQCCVQLPYTIKWFSGSNELISDPMSTNGENCITYVYTLENCSESPMTFICKVDDPSYEKRTVMNIFRGAVACNDASYGAGQEGDFSTIRCDEGQEGFKKAECASGTWTLLEDTCILTDISELLINSEDLVETDVPDFVVNLSETVRQEQNEIVDSPETISAIVDILENIANFTGEVSQAVIEDVLETVNVIIGDESRESWAFLNANGTSSPSSSLLASLEDLADRLVGEFNFTTERILLNRIRFNDTFTADLNSSVIIDLPPTNLSDVFITTIVFPTLNNVMPVRNSSFNISNAIRNETVIDHVINGAVVLVQINATIRNVSLSYTKLNNSLSESPQCVFWNFTLFNNLGAWDDEGCTFVSKINNTVTCNCNHLTSFSILMSTNLPPKAVRDALDIITYVGVAISLASLVICLIIEGYVWKAITRNSTAFMRHVCIINTALSLLIADICFIIGAFLAKNPLENPEEGFTIPNGPCTTATFFMHLFYLALFFWMLVSGLLLFYRTVMVFSHMSRSTMLGIGFLLGYGCPLIIAVITVAVTAPGNGYIRKDHACWLNWFDTHALLALVIPALTIVSINIVIVIVVLFKMLRRGVGDAAQTDERHTLVVILRCVIILTPLFGLTWSLGIGTLISSKTGIHIAFAFFNSLQGFFILVFGTLFDSKIRSILSRKSPTSSTGSNNTTRSTSGGISSQSGLNWINRLRGRRYIYHVSETANSNTGASESFTNI